MKDLNDGFYRLFDDGGEGGAGDNGGGNAGGGGNDNGGGGGGDVQLPDGAFFNDNRFRDALPEDIRADVGFEKIANLEGLARSYLSSQRLIGKDPQSLIEVPNADDADGFRSVMTKLGLPEDVNGYKLEAGENVAEAFSPTGDLATGFVAEAHKIGILPQQAQGIYGWFADTMTAANADIEAKLNAQADQDVRSLEGEWGQAFNQKVAQANFAIDKFGGEDLRNVLNEAGVGTNPMVMNMLASLGEMVAENSGEGDGGTGAGQQHFGGAMTPDEARSKGKALLQEANQLVMNDPRKRELNAEAQKYFQMANQSARS